MAPRPRDLRLVAVDWSGAAQRAVQRETIWSATVEDGSLVDLACGSTRREVVDDLVALAGDRDRRLVVGLDFAFGMPPGLWRLAADPAWAAAHRGGDAAPWRTARDVWAAACAHGDAWLRDCPAPFWGLKGTRRPDRAEPPTATGAELRRGTDGPATFSPLQIAGAGAVGTGSLRGMPHLLELEAAGFWVWPFARPAGWSDGDPVVMEIHPRAFVGATVKSRWADRHVELVARYAAAGGEGPGDAVPAQPLHLLERAAGSPDAFDAAVSALELARHADALLDLQPAPAGEPAAREGQVWRPQADPVPAPVGTVRASRAPN